MSQLRILRLRDAGSDCWYVRFGGSDEDFHAMRRLLKAEYPFARWEPDALGKKRGAWLVSHAFLHAYRDRFENYQQCIEREQLRHKLEQQRQTLAAVEQRRRELGIPQNITDCPF